MAKEQGFPFEEPEDEKPESHDGLYALKYFAAEGKDFSETKKKASADFRHLAEFMAATIPMGTVRTSSLERLLDIRELTLRYMK